MLAMCYSNIGMEELLEPVFVYFNIDGDVSVHKADGQLFQQACCSSPAFLKAWRNVSNDAVARFKLPGNGNIEEALDVAKAVAASCIG